MAINQTPDIKPLGNRVVVRRASAETTTKGGILIPENAKEKPLEGTVLAVGPGKRTDSGSLVPMDIQPGDVVMFGKYAGVDVSDDLLILRDDEILATTGA